MHLDLLCIPLLILARNDRLIKPRLKLICVDDASLESIKIHQGRLHFLRVLFSAALPAPIANLPRIYSARDYSRCRAHVLSGVIISFKCGALANPSISRARERSVNLTLFLRPLPHLRSRPFIFPYYSTLLISSSALLPPLNSRRYYMLPPVLSSILGEFRFFFFPSPPLPLASSYFSFITYYRPPPVVFRALRKRLLQLARLRFPQDNR